MSRLFLIVFTLAAWACTFDDGSGFATLERASLSARFEPGAREVGPNAVLTDLAYQVSLSKLSLRVEQLSLEERSDAPAEPSFDPEDPPVGFFSCHEGECQTDDGRVVSYEAIEAALADRAVAFVVVAALPIEREIDLLAAPTLSLDRVEPSAELPQATLERAALALRGLSISGSAMGGTLAAPLAFELDVAPLGSLSQTLDFVIDRDAPETLALSADVRLDGTLFDGIDFAALAGAQTVLLSDLGDPAVMQVARAALASQFSVLVAGN
jgi:hypothetical protein